MATLRELKGRIGSVASSEKITGAMKMISSAKMHKAEGVLRRLSPFRDCVQTIIGNLMSSDAEVSSPLTEERATIQRVSVVVLGSDDGLCGAYNVNIFKGLTALLERLRERYGKDIEIDIIAVGGKLQKTVEKHCLTDSKLTFIPSPEVDSKSEGDAVKMFARDLERRFTDGLTDMIVLQYMHFFSAGKQRLSDGVYLPISSEALQGENTGGERPYLFEPDAESIFRAVLPMYLLSQLQEAFAQNRASEQAARVMAMQSANDNARKLLEQLQLEYNKLRQQSITTELLDIVGGQRRD